VEPRWLSGIALGYGLDNRGFESRQGLGIFLFTIASRLVLGPTRTPIQWVPGALSLGVKWLGRGPDHSLPSSDEVKNSWIYTPLPQYAFMAWCLFKKHRDFTFTLHFFRGDFMRTHQTWEVMPVCLICPSVRLYQKLLNGWKCMVWLWSSRNNYIQDLKWARGSTRTGYDFNALTPVVWKLWRW
jgi:hypothetical protein